jgi:hypothetical protein
MTRLRGGLVAAALLLSACPILSLSDVEKQNPSLCDGGTPCADGWHCGADGHCHEDATNGKCNDGDTQPCGSSFGECKPGTQTCSNGAFGACMGGVSPQPELCDGKDNDCNMLPDDNISDGGLCTKQQGVCQGSRLRCVSGMYETSCTTNDYGPFYEAVEMSCDGKDNDCNGIADDGLVKACPLNAGVCAGTQVSCLGGAFPQCATAVYQAHSGAYEAYETLCDGLDNDCDGLVDAWAPQNISGTPGRVSRRPSAVSINGNVLVLWEEEISAGTFGVQARVVHTDGSMTPAIFPSTTANAAQTSSIPAVAIDGNLVVGVWAETVVSMTTTTHRIQIAPLDPATGLSTLTGNGAAQVSGTAMPSEIAIAVDSAAGRVVVSWVEGTNLNATALATDFMSAPIFTKPNLASGVQHVQLAAAGGNAFWVTFETAGGIQRCFLNAAGTLSCTSTLANASSPIVFPVGAAPTVAVSLFVMPSGGSSDVFSSFCDGGSCTPAAMTPVPVRTAMSHLRATTATRNQAPTFAAWQESGTDFHFFIYSGDGGVQPSPGTNPGIRPVPVFTSPGHGAVVFDSEGLTSGAIPENEVFVARYCL